MAYDSIAEIYDLYVQADYDVPFFTAEVGQVKGAVLELMAGTGRLSLPLLEAGAKLTCVDSARGMLDVLERKAAARGFHPDVHCLDVCRLDFRAQFELALLPFQSFMELVAEQSQQDALAAVFRSLVPGGGFICTLHNPALRRAQVDGVLRVVGRFPTHEGTLVVSGFETGGRPVVTRLQFFEWFTPEGNSAWRRMLCMQFALIEKDTFATMALRAGFVIKDLYGNYDRTPFDAAASPVMIWRLEKPGA